MNILGRRYDTGKAVSLTLDGDRIRSIDDLSESTEDESTLPWISAGFVDLQINGYGGQEFNDLSLTPENVKEVSLALDACGVTCYLPTATTHSFEMLKHTLEIIAEACETIPQCASRIPGIHLEGPYISRDDGPRGAHPLQHVRLPDWDEFQKLQDAAQGRIRLLTLSPEYDGSADFIANVANSGVLVAIGHTAANSEQIEAAVDAGARMSTHLGNGAHGQIRRHPNYIWDQLADDRLIASLIADGHHLPASVVKSFVRAKTVDRCVLVSDMMGMGGMPPGLYEKTSIGAVEMLEDGRLVVAGQRQYLAGAALPIGVGVVNVMRFAGVNLKTAIEMVTAGPARLIGIDAGTLSAGSPADLALFDLPGDNDDANLRIRATVKSGEIVFGSLS